MAIFLLGHIKAKIDKDFLINNNCSLNLYNAIKSHGLYATRIEGSIKSTDNLGGRYTCTMLLSEYTALNYNTQKEILKNVNFTNDRLIEILDIHSNMISNNTDIIFGTSNSNIGKIYLDFNNGSLVCYESDGKIKYYSGNHKKLNVYHNGIKVSTHYRIRKNITFNNYPVYWIAKGQDKSITRYIRPRVSLIAELIDAYLVILRFSSRIIFNPFIL